MHPGSGAVLVLEEEEEVVVDDSLEALRCVLK